MREKHQYTSTTEAQPLTLEPLVPADAAGRCCGESAAAAVSAQEQNDVAECPVMAGTPVHKSQAEANGLYRDHDGQRYWFCCAACGPRFDADPDEYASA
ncbi:YHS domain-containing protein [Demequina sp. SO4-13]|uniref:YHS domain-containing protein n=1 Tax=Demequina sp. SO4-13 TaxID=3401027 RepID=UPI003AF53C2E